jgi:two-component system sensor histidine kinase KdpD
MADPALLERVLANVIANAVEFSPYSEPVRVSASRHRGDLQIYIVDHGPGIGVRDRATVTQPFHRLSDTTSNSGVGLGLAIADGLTAAMGGHLELRDTPRGGLTVVVSLPAADAGGTSGSASQSGTAT